LTADREESSRPRRQVFAGARTRILASYLVLLALSTVVTVVALRQILLARTGERVDSALVQEVDEFRRLVRDGRDPRTGRPFGDDLEAIFEVYLARNVPALGETFFTFLNGKPHRSSTSEPPRQLAGRLGELAATSDTARGEVETPTGTVRYLAVPVEFRGRQRGVFAVTIDLEHEREEVGDAVRVATGVSIAVLLLASLLAFVIAGRVLSPLRLLRDTARSIGESELKGRIPVEGRDEIADLARTFNAMLDRLEKAFESQKAFISDAGHELRTPITIIRGHLELLRDDPEERRETIELVTDELERMSRFVDDLLLLAKAQRPDFLERKALDLDAVTQELFAKARALAPRDWRLESIDRGRIVADRQRLTQAVMNLAQNAVQHTDEDATIALGAKLEGAYARLWVRDSGAGIPAAEQERIFERFARAENGRPRPDGLGLGLAIVRAIAEAHGGRVDLESRPGWGATFSVVIPAEPGREVSRA
jgi:two-component system, OmpR family, sensor kinase